jgi:hypothetical protein
MRRLFLSVVLACLAAVVAAGSATAKHGGVMCVLNTQLTAQASAPSTSAATGHAQIKVWNDGTISYKAQIFNPNHETFFAAHVHQAPVGVAGPIVVPLFGGPATSNSHIKLGGVATPSTGTTGANLCQNPSAYYVNFHTTVFTAGAIRGQL